MPVAAETREGGYIWMSCALGPSIMCVSPQATRSCSWHLTYAISSVTLDFLSSECLGAFLPRRGPFFSHLNVTFDTLPQSCTRLYQSDVCLSKIYVKQPMEHDLGVLPFAARGRRSASWQCPSALSSGYHSSHSSCIIDRCQHSILFPVLIS